MTALLHELQDESGLILRGGAAVVGLVVMGILCLFAGPAGWATFAMILLGSAVLTGFNMLFSSIGQRREERRYEQQLAASRAAAATIPASRPAPTPAPTQTDQLADRAVALGKQYASDIADIGDDAIALLRGSLEETFGEDAVAMRWSEIRSLLVSASKARRSQ